MKKLKWYQKRVAKIKENLKVIAEVDYARPLDVVDEYLARAEEALETALQLAEQDLQQEETLNGRYLEGENNEG